MPSQNTRRPAATEYAPYYEKYIRLVPDGDIVDILRRQLDSTVALLTPLTEEKAAFAYAPGKWTLKEALGHVMDTERVFAYRALCIARGDTTALPGFEQDDYVRGANFNEQTLGDLLQEYRAVRQATIALFQSFPAAAWERMGTANDNPIGVRALAYNIAGHEIHHVTIVREKYVP